MFMYAQVVGVCIHRYDTNFSTLMVMDTSQQNYIILFRMKAHGCWVFRGKMR